MIICSTCSKFVIWEIGEWKSGVQDRTQGYWKFICQLHYQQTKCKANFFRLHSHDKWLREQFEKDFHHKSNVTLATSSRFLVKNNVKSMTQVYINISKDKSSNICSYFVNIWKALLDVKALLTSTQQLRSDISYFVSSFLITTLTITWKCFSTIYINLCKSEFGKISKTVFEKHNKTHKSWMLTNWKT